MVKVFAPCGNVIENRPSRSVVVPALVFSLQTMPAPMTASPSLSMTMPEKIPFWAPALIPISSRAIKGNMASFVFIR